MKKIDLTNLFATPKRLAVAAQEAGVSYLTILKRIQSLPKNYEIRSFRNGNEVYYTIKKNSKSDNSSIFIHNMQERGCEFVKEYRFHSVRKWRFDFANVENRIAVEVEGGVFIGGRHTRGVGFLGDIEKYNTAALFKWRVIRTTPQEVCTEEFADFVKLFF